MPKAVDVPIRIHVLEGAQQEDTPDGPGGYAPYIVLRMCASKNCTSVGVDAHYSSMYGQILISHEDVKRFLDLVFHSAALALEEATSKNVEHPVLKMAAKEE